MSEKNRPHTTSATAKRFSSTTEYTDQYITDPKNHSSARFTFLINKFQSFLVLVHPNIPGQYITNIPARGSRKVQD